MAFLYETHMHTSEVSKCAVNTAAEQVKAYKNRGYTGIIVTDHFVHGYSNCPQHLPWDKKIDFIMTGYYNAKKAGEKYGLQVFLGWEFPDYGWDFLTYGLDEDFLKAYPSLLGMPVEEYSPLVRKHGGYIAQAHPFRDADYVQRHHPADHRLLDGMEVFNASISKKINAKALTFAEQHGLAKQAGSDSHSAWLRTTGGIKLQKPAADIFDIIRALKTGDVELKTG